MKPVPRGLPYLAAALLGAVAGWLDFQSGAPAFYLAFLIPAAAALGFAWPSRSWRLTLVLGLAVPTTIILGMALRLQPARPHFVLADARAVIPALAAAWVGAWIRQREAPTPRQEAREERAG